MSHTVHNPTSSVDRRSFVKQAGGAALAGSALSMSARSYARVVGANDRLRIAQLGSGGRGSEHIYMVKMASRQTAVETVAVCDLWSYHRERAAREIQKLFGVQPQAFKYHEEMLARPDIDGVMIATGDFQHARLCADVVRAGKDCYVEKPFANTLDDAKLARAAVKNSKQIVQMGTQHRSQPYPLAVRDLIQSGRIGKVVKIQQEWDTNQPRWRGRPEVKLLREADTDWQRWLLGKPDRPFDPHMYLEFRLYKDFSSGLFDQWLSHASDLVHLWTDETHPLDAFASGGVFVWNDGRENPDTCTVSLCYPKGFMSTYTSTFGNSYRSFSRIQGTDGTIENFGGEGASLFLLTREGGQHEPDPADGYPRYTAVPGMGDAREKAEILQVPGAPNPNSMGPSDNDVVHLGHWLTAMRERKQPNATVDHGFSHAIVCIMAAQSYWSGKKLYWDAQREEIVDQPLKA